MATKECLNQRVVGVLFFLTLSACCTSTQGVQAANPNANVKAVLDQYKIELREAGDRGQCDEATARVREALLNDLCVSDADLQAEIDDFEKVKGPMAYPSPGTACSLFGFQTVAHEVLEQRKSNPMGK